MFGNGGMLGLSVSLSHALGLNRDPSDWKLAPSEKIFRVRVWSLVLIHDRWYSLAYGTPPLVQSVQFDTPVPKVEDLCGPTASEVRRLASAIFVSFVTLTTVLGDFLQHLYCIQKPKASSNQAINSSALEHLLQEWEDSLDGVIRRLVLHGVGLNIPGAANFRLAYLAVKLLLRRIEINEEDETTASNRSNHARSIAYSRAQRAAEDIVHLISDLNEEQLRGFWTPVHAFSITSATRFLLRCALRYHRNGGSDHNTPLELAESLLSTLRSYEKDFAWDLADHCLSQCTELLLKVKESVSGEQALPSISDCFPLEIEMEWPELFGNLGDRDVMHEWEAGEVNLS